MNIPAKKMVRIISAAIAVILIVWIVSGIYRWLDERAVLKKVIERLSADSRIAEVLVTKSIFNEETKAIETTIKFLEFDSSGKPLEPHYFTFQGNIIQFQTLVIRFEDRLVAAGDQLRGKSIYLFMKVFMLNGSNSQVFDLTAIDEIPIGYKVPGLKNKFEDKLWKEFWSYALDPKKRSEAGIKNAQIEAPGTMFLPGTVYTIKIEHDGGIRIDTEPVREILKGETVER